ncbi:MAG: PH domain-containing protein [Intestinibacter sp.]|uniref:PH domain-containing protein n=1 Tax=Intestinibacter sp. TaxID=1965304 RepID=UPI0025BBD205|nr:PH domain-containing protein [Intestinibacter sp.]MCI6737133.1 PH domain-containing protein [Intestinibacter sp.]
MEYQKLNKKAIKCMFLGTLVQFIIVTAILFAVWWNFKNILPTVVQGVMLGLFVVDLVYLLASPKIRYEKYRYCITKDRIDVKEGFIFTERNIVPIERLHKIAIEKGPIDNIFGLSKVIVTTAGGDVTISFLEDEKANFIVDSLKDKINQIAIDEKNADL